MYFYKTMAWLNKRAEVLERDNYECQMCKAEGRYGRGNVVHHIKHLTHRPDLALEDDCSSIDVRTAHESASKPN